MPISHSNTRLRSTCVASPLLARQPRAAMPVKKAAPSIAAPGAEISKMLGVLKYNANTGKNPEKSDAASKALVVYNSLVSTADRAQFVTDFENNGSGKNAGSFKFAMTFKKSLEATKEEQISATENWFTRHPSPQTILNNGLNTLPGIL